MIHTMPLKIYYEDTDAGGIVYHANYLNFAERARTELLNDLGYSNNTLKDDPGILFVVRKATLDYHKPGYLEDELEVHTTIPEMRNSSMMLKQVVYRPKDDTLLCEIEIVLVCVGTKGPKAMKPYKIPESVRSQFQTYITD